MCIRDSYKTVCMCIVALIVYIKAISNNSEYSPWTPQNIENRQMVFVGGNIIVHIYRFMEIQKKGLKCVLPWQCRHCFWQVLPWAPTPPHPHQSIFVWYWCFAWLLHGKLTLKQNYVMKNSHKMRYYSCCCCSQFQKLMKEQVKKQRQNKLLKLNQNKISLFLSFFIIFDCLSFV